jgi:hypothetical protein
MLKEPYLRRLWDERSREGAGTQGAGNWAVRLTAARNLASMSTLRQ